MKTFVKLLSLLSVLACGHSAVAQKTCDLSVLAEASPTILNYGDTTFISITITNNGTADLAVSDTIYWGLPGFDFINIQDVVANVLTGPIAPGASQTLVKKWFIIHGFDTLTADRPLSSCVKLYHHAAIKRNGVPIPVKYIDPISANDSSCVLVTYKKKPTLGIFEFSDKGEQLTIYPNPAVTEIMFDIKLDKSENIKVFVKDISGRTVINRDFGRMPAQKMTQLHQDISKLQTGMYFIEVKGAQKIATGKFVVK